MKSLLFKIIRYINLFQIRFIPVKTTKIVTSFHQLYYDYGFLGKTWAANKFLGIPVQKCPFDLFVYQEILFDTRPDLIIECGTAYGGTALFLATICDALNHGEILTIDIEKFKNTPKHNRITYLVGSSTSKKIATQIEKKAKKYKKVMVILDSKHTKDHVLQELQLYHALVSKGCYLIVEDSNVNGHPVRADHGPGPMEALEEFLTTNTDFEGDTMREGALLTFNPKGYLRKK